MKKIFAVTLAVCFLYMGQALAYLIPPAFPFSPSLDIIDDALDTGKGILKHVRTVSDKIRTVKEEILNKITATVKSLIPFDLTQSPLKKEDGASVIAVAKEIKDANIANIKDKDSVAEAYKKMFLTLPEDLIAKVPTDKRQALVKLYERKGNEFIADSQMENYMAAHSLRTERLPLIEKENKSMQECYVEGKEGVSAICQGASASDETLGNWANYYKIKEAQDKILRMQEELAAIDSQYEAAITLKTGVKPTNQDVLRKGVSSDEE